MRILLVEDEVKLAHALKRGLTQEHFIIDVAASGDEGLEMALLDTYDLLILDVMLPKLSGFEIAQSIRQERLSVPILMLTARGELADKILGFEAGVDDYLTKPFAFEELLARIRALLKRPKELSEHVFTCDDLQLNTQTYDVKRGDVKIQLSRKEFALLEYMLRNKDRVLTKDTLVAHVWDYDSDILPNTVEQFIKGLREKIDKPFPQSAMLIHTVRGFGYKLTANV
ncbi:MAG: two-component response regulator, YkoH [Candidatus Parcubacteria bacterium]|jgi:DNA-binding response OmpR family regulator